MKTNISDLLASLPEAESESSVLDSEDAQQRLKQIFADLAFRPVPVHSIHRLWTLGELSTQITLAYLARWVRGWFADAKAKQRQEMETNLSVALTIIHRLGYLRGAATKLGQMFGNLPEVIPDQIVSTLDTLHSEAPPMHFSLIREMVRNELGGDPEDIFASFDKQPFAAASIGQVHRATLKSGESVAVKIQYPGIGRAIDADVRNLMALIFPMRLTRQWESAKGQCTAIQQMLAEEADYVHEAKNMKEVRACFKPVDRVVVPAVFEQYSTARVLTMEYLSGPHLRGFLAANPTQAKRNSYASIIYRVWCRMCFAYLSHGDPNPGNLVFMEDGRLGLLDFGCVQRFTEEEREQIRRTDRYLSDPSHFPEVLLAGGLATKKDLDNPDFMRLTREFWQWSFGPEQIDGVFDFSNESFFKKGIELTRDMAAKRYTAAAPMYVYLSRSTFALRALLLRLGAKINVREIHQEELALRRARDGR
jgi:aarF domain-containing kinase